MVGRERELATLWRLLDRAAAGLGSVALVEGEAGIGKSRLVAELAAEARQRGAAVLSGAGDELDRSRPFRLVVQALGVTSSSSDPRRRAIAALLDGSGPGNVGGRIVEECLSLVETLALDAPQLVVFEDVHWADPSSLLMLRALGSVADLPVVTIETMRPLPRAPELVSTIDGLLAAGAIDIRVQPLSPGECFELAVVLGADDGPATRDRATAAAGNPLFMTELVRAEHSPGAAGLPPTLRAAILRRLAYLPEPTLEVLRLAAMLGSSFAVGDLAVAGGTTTVSLLPALRDALTAQVLAESSDGLHFRHDLLREALYEDLPEVVRRTLHREIASALMAADAAPERVAGQLVLGAEPGDLDAVRWLRRAAEDVSRRDLGVAIELLERAAELCAEVSTERDAVEAELAELLGWAGRIADLEALIRRRREMGSLATDEATESMVLALFLSGVADLRELADEAAEAASDERRRVMFRMVALAWLPESVPLARHARQLARAIGDQELEALACLVEALPEGMVGHYAVSEALLAEAEAAFAAAGTARARRARVATMVMRSRMSGGLGRQDEAVALRRRARTEAEAQGMGTVAASVDLWDAVDALWQGRFDESRAALEGAAEATHHGDVMLYLALLALWTGDRAAFETWHGQLAAATTGSLAAEYGAEVEMLRGLAMTEAGDHAGAHAALATAWNDAATGELFPSVAYPPLIKAARATGDEALLHAVVTDAHLDAERSHAASGPAVARWCQALADRDPVELSAARADFEALERPREAALTAEDLGLVLAEQGDRLAARDALVDAADRFEALGMRPALARVAEQLRLLGVRRGSRASRSRPATGWESLTPAELRVVELVASGLTNPQVAEHLFISRHTVVSHLKHVYAKLGLSSRVELVAAFTRRTG
jgi:DNA-binding CsgD family transcriptional regulator